MTACRVSVSEITILLLYLLAAATFGMSRLPRFSERSRPLFLLACFAVANGIFLHSYTLNSMIFADGGFRLSLGNTVSMIGLELALIGLIAAIEAPLRGISAGLLALAAVAAAATVGGGADSVPATGAAWQVHAHVLVALLSYGLLTVGAIVAVYAMIQERRLQAGRLSPVNALFAPLETTERLLFGITAAGFAGLTIAILSGLAFVDNLFAQHLVHKTALSLLALLVFGALLTGRFLAGWRGNRAVRLYLGGFLLLCLAYFGTRLILEQLLGRSWG